MGTSEHAARLSPATKREWISGITGILLTLFVLAHLAGIQWFYGGPAAFEGYAARMKGMPAVVGIVRLGFTLAFFAHAVFGVWVFACDRAAREARYTALGYGRNARLASWMMLLTGLAVFVVVPPHLKEFTFVAAQAAREGGPGLYDIVWNAFSSPIHALIYVVFVGSLGLHVAYSRVWATLGVLESHKIRTAEWAARAIGLIVVLGFAAIPIFVLMHPR